MNILGSEVQKSGQIIELMGVNRLMGIGNTDWN